VSNAATAQGTANTAVSNAATAQGTANTALAASLPAGSIYDFAGTTCPAGSLVMAISASNISRSTYSALFAAIGTTWGAGDGSTTFGMPWMAANYSSVQASGNVGTSTLGVLQSHSHNIQVYVSAGGFPSLQAAVVSSSTPTLFASNTAGSGTSNLAAGVRLLKCIKY
jgi:microcystin-dependent protein